MAIPISLVPKTVVPMEKTPQLAKKKIAIFTHTEFVVLSPIVSLEVPNQTLNFSTLLP